MATDAPLLEAVDVGKVYPGVQALRGVRLALQPGEVTALMGENGAGKSTLIRIIAGLERPTTGELRLRGDPVTLTNAGEAQRAGVSVVSQEFRLVPQLTVAENIFLGNEITRRGLIRPAVSRERARCHLDEIGLDVDPSRTVESLSVGDQQMVEIARAVSRTFDILVMDEPTAALNGGEVTRLLDLVRRLRDQGKAILYVSHRLEEVFAISDHIAVFRDGRSVGDLKTGSTTEPELVELMLGRELRSFEASAGEGRSEPDRSARPRIEVEELRAPRVREPVSFAVRPGEIVGLAGLIGSGRTELMSSLFGMMPRTAGRVLVDGREVDLGSPLAAIRAGVFLLSENRKDEGILPHLDVLENMVVSARRRRRSFADRLPSRSRELSSYRRLTDELRIRVNAPGQFIGNLSGGNQQKVLFGRAVLTGCTVLLLNEPTRGVDVGAKVEIYQLIRGLAAEGVAVVVSSSDAPELVAIADRCLVMQAGRLRAELSGADLDEDTVLRHSVGTGPAALSAPGTDGGRHD